MDNIKPNVGAIGTLIQDPNVEERINRIAIAIDNGRSAQRLQIIKDAVEDKNPKERMGRIGVALKEPGFISNLKEMLTKREGI